MSERVFAREWPQRLKIIEEESKFRERHRTLKDGEKSAHLI